MTDTRDAVENPRLGIWLRETVRSIKVPGASTYEPATCGAPPAAPCVPVRACDIGVVAVWALNLDRVSIQRSCGHVSRHSPDRCLSGTDPPACHRSIISLLAHLHKHHELTS